MQTQEKLDSFIRLVSDDPAHFFQVAISYDAGAVHLCEGIYIEDASCYLLLIDALAKVYAGLVPNNENFERKIANEIDLRSCAYYFRIHKLSTCDGLILSVRKLGSSVGLDIRKKDGIPAIWISSYSKNSREYVFLIGENKPVVIQGSRAKRGEYGKLCWYPASFANCALLPQPFSNFLLGESTSALPIYKDFVRDAFFPSIPCEALPELYTKREYIEKYYHVQLPSSSNKKSLQHLAAAACAQKYVLRGQEQILFSMTSDLKDAFAESAANKDTAESHDYNCQQRDVFYVAGIEGLPYASRTPKSKKWIAATLLGWYFHKKWPDEPFSTIRDGVRMMMQEKMPIDLFCGKKRFRAMHDAAAETFALHEARRIEREYAAKHKKSVTPLEFLRLPKPFKKLTTAKNLAEEGALAHNCVASYIDLVLEGKSAIFSVDYKGEHLTVEVGLSKSNHLYVAQCYRPYNRNCSKAAYQFVKDSVTAAEGDMMARYKKAKETKKEKRVKETA